MFGMLAGEPSGDLLGASLLRALQQKNPSLTSSGIGGPAMLQEGFQSQYVMERLSVMGLVEPLFRLPELFRIRRGIIQYFLQQRPSVFVGIDSPDFNLGVEYQLRAANIPVVHYVSPSVWAWRQKRIHKIAKSVDLMLTLFPFEAAFYEKNRVPVQFVGHPLADQIPLESQKQISRRQLGLDANGLYLAIMPGSRAHEIKYLADVFLRAAKHCQKKMPQLQFITSAANAARQAELSAISQTIAPELSLQFFENASHAVMAASDVVLVGSGTATLEAMLLKKPMVIAYRMAGLTYQIAKHLVKIPFIGLPNLLANECVVPEFIQQQATPENLAHAILEWFSPPEKINAIEEKFTMLHRELKCNASEKAAQAIMQLV